MVWFTDAVQDSISKAKFINQNYKMEVEVSIFIIIKGQIVLNVLL